MWPRSNTTAFLVFGSAVIIFFKYFTSALEVDFPKYGFDSVEHEVIVDFQQLRNGIKIGHIPRYNSDRFAYRLVFDINEQTISIDDTLKKQIENALLYQNVALLDDANAIIDIDSIRFFSDKIYKAHLIDNQSNVIKRWSRHYLEIKSNLRIPENLLGVKVSICLFRKSTDWFMM